MIDTDDEQASQVIWRYADEPLDTLIAVILSLGALFVVGFWVGVWRLVALLVYWFTR